MRELVDDLTAEQLAALDKEVLVAVILEMRGQMAQMAADLQALKDQLAKDSGNSSKPPSSDGLKKPRTKSLREKGQRASGGQVGHRGQTLRRVETPDVVVRYGLEICRQCQHDLRTGAAEGWKNARSLTCPGSVYK
jgi:transposase